jgi:hypothetical protein
VANLKANGSAESAACESAYRNANPALKAVSNGAG